MRQLLLLLILGSAVPAADGGGQPALRFTISPASDAYPLASPVMALLQIENTADRDYGLLFVYPVQVGLSFHPVPLEATGLGRSDGPGDDGLPKVRSLNIPLSITVPLIVIPAHARRNYRVALARYLEFRQPGWYSIAWEMTNTECEPDQWETDRRTVLSSGTFPIEIRAGNEDLVARSLQRGVDGLALLERKDLTSNLQRISEVCEEVLHAAPEIAFPAICALMNQELVRGVCGPTILHAVEAYPRSQRVALARAVFDHPRPPDPASCLLALRILAETGELLPAATVVALIRTHHPGTQFAVFTYLNHVARAPRRPDHQWLKSVQDAVPERLPDSDPQMNSELSLVIGAATDALTAALRE